MRVNLLTSSHYAMDIGKSNHVPDSRALLLYSEGSVSHCSVGLHCVVEHVMILFGSSCHFLPYSENKQLRSFMEFWIKRRNIYPFVFSSYDPITIWFGIVQNIIFNV